jgi:hypothetical protein
MNVLTPRSRDLLETLIGSQLVKKFLTFHGTQRFITALTSLRHMHAHQHQLHMHNSQNIFRKCVYYKQDFNLPILCFSVTRITSHHCHQYHHHHHHHRQVKLAHMLWTCKFYFQSTLVFIQYSTVYIISTHKLFQEPKRQAQSSWII